MKSAGALPWALFSGYTVSVHAGFGSMAKGSPQGGAAEGVFRDEDVQEEGRV